MILLIGTVSSGVTGAIGGMLGRFVTGTSRAAA